MILNEASSKPVKSERVRRREHAERTARWRASVADRPEPRTVDRILVEALVVALADATIVPAPIAAAVMRQVADNARAGLLRLGYDDAASRKALASRLVQHGRHSQTSAVRPALSDLDAAGHIRRRRTRTPAERSKT